MKFRNRNKDKGEKSIVSYYAQYIGLLGSNKYIPTDQDTYIHLYEDMLIVQFLKLEGVMITIPYYSIVDILNLDGGEKISPGRVVGAGLIALPLAIVGALWKKHHIITVIKYLDFATEPETLALDFGDNLQYAQSFIYEKILMSRQGVNYYYNDVNVFLPFSAQPQEDRDGTETEKSG